MMYEDEERRGGYFRPPALDSAAPVSGQEPSQVPGGFSTALSRLRQLVPGMRSTRGPEMPGGGSYGMRADQAAGLMREQIGGGGVMPRRRRRGFGLSPESLGGFR